MDRPPLILVRHARPLVQAGTCYGVLDVAADDSATAQSADALAAKLPLQCTALVSPLGRCQQLARALQIRRPTATFITEPRLAEMDFGVWEGVPWEHIPKPAVDAWIANFSDHLFGGKESANDVLGRVATMWDAVPAAQLWITHAGVIRCAMLLAQGIRHLERADQWPATVPGYGESVTL